MWVSGLGGERSGRKGVPVGHSPTFVPPRDNGGWGQGLPSPSTTSVDTGRDWGGTHKSRP